MSPFCFEPILTSWHRKKLRAHLVHSLGSGYVLPHGSKDAGSASDENEAEVLRGAVIKSEESIFRALLRLVSPDYSPGALSPCL